MFCPKVVKQKYNLKRHVQSLHAEEKMKFDKMYRYLTPTDEENSAETDFQNYNFFR